MSKPVRRSRLRRSFTGRFCTPTPTISEPVNSIIRQSGNPAIQRSAHCAIGPMLTPCDARGFLEVTQLEMA